MSSPSPCRRWLLAAAAAATLGLSGCVAYPYDGYYGGGYPGYPGYPAYAYAPPVGVVVGGGCCWGGWGWWHGGGWNGGWHR
jgi:hypothetical protein